MAMRFELGLVGAGLAVGAAMLIGAGAACAQQNIDSGSPGYFGGYSTFGGYYNTYGGNGGFGGHSGYGSYRRVDEGASSTTNSTTTFATLPFPGGAETSNHCAWLKVRAARTHQKKWRERYASCLRDYSGKY